MALRSKGNSFSVRTDPLDEVLAKTVGLYGPRQRSMSAAIILPTTVLCLHRVDWGPWGPDFRMLD